MCKAKYITNATDAVHVMSVGQLSVSVGACEWDNIYAYGERTATQFQPMLEFLKENLECEV